MKKSKLIELLSQIEGDPEIVLWNGLVGDYQDISSEVIDEFLTKDTFDAFKKRWLFEKQCDHNDYNLQLSDIELKECKKSYNKNNKWEYNQFITLDDIQSGQYKKKRVLFLQAKLRNESYHDRLGKISY